MEKWGALGVSLFTLCIVALVAATYFGAPKAIDIATPNGPGIPPELADHQERTIHSYLTLKSLAPEIQWVPVLQGWTLADYCVIRCNLYGVSSNITIRSFKGTWIALSLLWLVDSWEYGTWLAFHNAQPRLAGGG